MEKKRIQNNLFEINTDEGSEASGRGKGNNGGMNNDRERKTELANDEERINEVNQAVNSVFGSWSKLRELIKRDLPFLEKQGMKPGDKYFALNFLKQFNRYIGSDKNLLKQCVIAVNMEAKKIKNES